jgi:hypothetical protein
MRSIQRLKLPVGMSFLPSLERAAAARCCTDCQSDQVRRSRTRGIVESLLAVLLIRPYRCEACDCRFFRLSIRHKPKATRASKENQCQ